jgi:hypothetical protein
MRDPEAERDPREVWAVPLAYVLLFGLWGICILAPHVALWYGGPWWSLAITVAAFLVWMYVGPPPTCFGGGNLMTSFLGMMVFINSLGGLIIAVAKLVITYHVPH